MTNYIRPGYSRQFTASGVVAPNDIILFNAGANGSIGVSKDAYANAATGCEAQIAGVFRVPKATGIAMPAGTKVWWDNTAKNVTTTSTSNTPAGEIHADAASGDTTAVLLLNGRPGPNLY